MTQEYALSQKSTLSYEDFQETVTPFRNHLYNFGLKLTQNPDDADDLVQDTFVKAFRFHDKFENGTNIKAWLFMILKNTFINNYRRSTRQPDRVDYENVQNFYENVKPEDVRGEHTEKDAFADLLDDEISNAISELEEDYRTVVILSDIEGFTYDEIAEFIDRPVGTVRSRLHRARKMLYSKLYDYALDRGFAIPEPVLAAA